MRALITIGTGPILEREVPVAHVGLIQDHNSANEAQVLSVLPF